MTQKLREKVDEIPQLNAIRQDLLIQALVEKKLKDLVEAQKAGTHKQKSLRRGPVEVLVSNKIKWLHKYVLSALHKVGALFIRSTFNCTMNGWLCLIMREGPTKFNASLPYMSLR